MGELKIETKVCSRCNLDKPLDRYYSQKKKKPNGEETIYYFPYCKDCISKDYQENKDEYNKKNLEYKRNNRDKIKPIAKRTEQKYKDKRSELRKEWRKNNKDKIKEYNEKYKHKQFKITSKQWQACKLYFNNCCAYCGISDEEAKEIQGKHLHKEHAMNKGKNDLSNCVPSCTDCNSSKHLDDYTDWYCPGNPVYNKERNNLIHKWLNNDYINFI